MISVTEALSIIRSISTQNKNKKVDLKNALNHILSKDILSPISMPPFRQSAMDGYALLIGKSNTYSIIGEVKAGDPQNYILEPGQAVRIFTGARVPNNANTIVIQEKVSKLNDTITIETPITVNQNIRHVGEQIKKGDIALPKGTLITPAGIGLLAGLGVEQADVFSAPKVGIITTGSELVSPGNTLMEGQIYESNSIQLATALMKLNCTEIQNYTVEDNYDTTKEIINNAIQNNDLVLISGGISVGDYDFVKQALLELKTEELFYKIKQKPGKPLYFGKNNTTLIFALPGNPASSLTCFYIYVVPILKKIMGHKTSELIRTKKNLVNDYIKKGDRAQFLKAISSDKTVEILEGQSSSMLHTYAISNALVYIPDHITEVKKNEPVETILLPV